LVALSVLLLVVPVLAINGSAVNASIAGQGGDLSLQSAADSEEPTCGNGTCDPDEDVFSCPEDCPPVCGNGVLEPTEE
jgi:hypothetical protein